MCKSGIGSLSTIAKFLLRANEFVVLSVLDVQVS